PVRARREPGDAPWPADHRRGAARHPRPVGPRLERGPAPPDGGRGPRDGEGRMKAVNLIPTDQRKAQASGERAGGGYVVLGVLAVLLVMAVAYVVTANGVNDNKTKAAKAQREADTLEAQASQLQSFTNFSGVKEA